LSPFLHIHFCLQHWLFFRRDIPRRLLSSIQEKHPSQAQNPQQHLNIFLHHGRTKTVFAADDKANVRNLVREQLEGEGLRGVRTTGAGTSDSIEGGI
jgi:hypothetical protein